MMKRNKYLVILALLMITIISGGVFYAKRTTYFTLTGEVPAQIKLVLKVRYEPKQGTDECVIHKKIKSYDMYLNPETVWQEQDSTYQLTLPTFLRVKGCFLPIRSVNIEALGKYGEYMLYGKKYDKEDGDRFAASIGFYDARDEKLLDKQPLYYRSLCQWTFRIMPEGLVKILNCKAPNEQWQLSEDRFKQGKLSFYLARNNLAGQTVTVDFRLNPKEKPYFEGSWLKTDQGWRLCQETETTRRCQTPPTFSTFEMDGKTCTVYPNCTEQ